MGFHSVKELPCQRKGSILLIALWTICLLSTFAVSIGFAVRQKTTLVRRLDAKDTLRLLAEAGVEKAICALKADPEKGYDSLQDGLNGGPAVEGSGTVIVADEERKINVNRSDRASLIRLFRCVLDYDPTQAQELAASIIDWRDLDSALSIPLGSAEDSYYRNTSFPYEAKDAALEVMEELLFVKGMDKAVLGKVSPYLTVYGDGRVNINTASLPVLLALGFSAEVSERIISLRKGKDEREGTMDDHIFTSVGDVVAGVSQHFNLGIDQIDQMNAIVQQGVAVASRHFLITSVAVLSNKKDASRIECVVNRRGEILRWKESYGGE